MIRETLVVTNQFIIASCLRVQNGTLESVDALITVLNDAKEGMPENVDVLVAPTFVHIPRTQSALRKDFVVSAQNCWIKGNGAYTGEVSADMLADMGLSWVILGHSERRHIIGESDQMIADKVVYALSKGLSVVYCIGETLEERDAGNTSAVCERQMKALADAISAEDWNNIVVAYEPVWAIGTGKVATPDQAQEVHENLRGWMSKAVSDGAASNTRIIYGGSVNAKNCADLAGRPDIDGFLVGGASLKPEFIDIIKSASIKSS
jgi:triosephosphate isomerase